MSIRCDDCRYLFSKKRSGCPFCGGPTIQDDRPDADLLSAGYTVAPQGRQRTTPADPFEAMLRAYQEEQQQTQPIPIPSPAAEPSEPKQPKVGWISSPSSRAAPLRWTSPRWTPPIVLLPSSSLPNVSPRISPTPMRRSCGSWNGSSGGWSGSTGAPPSGTACPACAGGRCFGWWCSYWWWSPPSAFGRCATLFLTPS